MKIIINPNMNLFDLQEGEGMEFLKSQVLGSFASTIVSFILPC